MNIRYLKKFIFIGVLLMVFNFCRKDENLKPFSNGYNYFPVNLGNWIIYDVRDLYYNDFTGNIDSSHYKIKEVITEVLKDNADRDTYKIERYKKNSDTSEWNLQFVCYENLTLTTAERFENNSRYIKLVFPVFDGKKWNSNAANADTIQIFKYKDIYKSTIINGTVIDSTITVLQKDEVTKISKIFSEEMYGNNIGLVYKRDINVVMQPTGVITKGTDITYNINSYYISK